MVYAYQCTYLMWIFYDHKTLSKKAGHTPRNALVCLLKIQQENEEGIAATDIYSYLDIVSSKTQIEEKRYNKCELVPLPCNI